MLHDVKKSKRRLYLNQHMVSHVKVKKTLWKNNLNLVEDVPMAYINLIKTVTISY